MNLLWLYPLVGLLVADYYLRREAWQKPGWDFIFLFYFLCIVAWPILLWILWAESGIIPDIGVPARYGGKK